MGKHALLKEIATSTSIYSIAVIAGKMASFLLLPLYTRYLTPADYGVLELLEMTSFLFSSLIGMRIGDALFFYYSKAKTDEEKNQTICTIFAGAVLLGGLGASIGSLAAPWISDIVFGTRDYTTYFYFVFGSFFFSVPLEVGFCYMRAVNRPVAYVAASMTRLGLAIALNVLLLVGFKMRVQGVLLSSLLGAGFMATYMIIFSLLRIRVREAFTPSMLRGFLRYSFPLVISSLSMFTINYADRLFLRHHVSLAELGIYSLAYKIGMLILYALMPFEIYWSAQKFKLVKGPDGDKIFVRVCTYLMLAMTYMVVLMTIFARPIIRIMASPEFADAAIYVPWIAAAYLVRIIGTHFRNVFFLTGKTRTDAGVMWFGALVCIVGYAVLIPVFRLWGAIAATGLAFSSMLAASLWQAQKVRHYAYEYRRFAMILMAAIVAALPAALLPENIWLHVILGAALACLYPAMLFLIGFFNAEERQMFAAVFQQVRYRVAAATNGLQS